MSVLAVVCPCGYRIVITPRARPLAWELADHAREHLARGEPIPAPRVEVTAA